MNILYIANVRMPSEKAHTIQIAKMLEAFSLAGNTVRLLIPRRKNYIQEDIFSYYNLKTKFIISYLPNYLRFLETVHKKLYFKWQRLLFNLTAFIQGLKAKEDVIYSREIIISYLLTLFGKTVVFEDHEPPKSKLWIYKIFLKKINKKIIVPFNLARVYKEYGVKNYLVVPNGVDLEEFKNVQEDKSIWKEMGIKEDKVILYVGHFYKWKGVYTLMDAAKKIDQAVVLVGGTDEDRQDLIKYIEDNSLKNVYIKKFVPHIKAIQYLKSADVLALPNTAQEERSAKYTTPIKLFEYMASNIPVIASNLQSFNYYLNDNNAVLFEPDQANNLAEKIKYVLGHPQIARDISQQARQDVAEYTWHNRAKKILNFIKDE